MISRKVTLVLGAISFVVGIGMNIQYAMANYGITQSPLHPEVLAQSNDSTGGGTPGGGGTAGSLWKRHPENCSISVTGQANAEGTILGIKVRFNADGIGVLTVTDASTSCESGGTFKCTDLSCGQFWINVGLGTSGSH